MQDDAILPSDEGLDDGASSSEGAETGDPADEATESDADKASESDADSTKDDAKDEGATKAEDESSKTPAGSSSAVKKTNSTKGSIVPASVTAIYVNGSKGTDSNDGISATTAVKTFAKAKEFMDLYGCNVIYVLGALEVSGDGGTWELGGKTLARGDDYHGYLINLVKNTNASLTLKDIVLDGRAGEGQYGRWVEGWGGGGALIGVYNGATLNLLDGVVLKNNRILSEGKWYPEGGGAIAMTNSTLNMYGGKITDCEAVNGGGIYAVYKSVINLYDGEISGNRAIQGASKGYSDADKAGCGGGICVFEGADINMHGGLIANNSAYARGGGISLGTYWTSMNGSSILNMFGGTISGNSAGNTGGGIFIQAGLSASGSYKIDSYSIAYIYAGNIIGNKTTGNAVGNNAFGGGGIYVNGYSSSYRDFHNGELYLTNVVISGNHAAIAGGGYAGCPVSTTEIYLTNGSAFYGNSTDSGLGNEIYVLATQGMGAHTGNPWFKVSPSMLGGGAYRWVYADGTEVPLDQLSGTLYALYNQYLALGNLLDSNNPDVIKALGMAKVFIMGNTSATRGGGIGSNGSIIIGESSKNYPPIGVDKVWVDADNKDSIRPDSVRVNVYRDGVYVGYQMLKADDDWIMSISNLPLNDGNGHRFTYTIEEAPVDGYQCEINETSMLHYTITNTAVVSAFGDKVWNDENDRDGIRPGSIVVNLYKDGELVDSQVVDADGQWKYAFNGLLRYDEDGRAFVYTIDETPVEGYETDIKGSIEDGFTITNTHWSDTPFDPSGDDDPDDPSDDPDNPGGNVPGEDTPGNGGSDGDNPQGITYQAGYSVNGADASSLSQGANPATGDSPMAAFALFAIALIGAFAACVARRKAQARF